MARYDATHKQASRARIVEAARQEFRASGFDEASIDSLMKGAGLTRGAFYAHFDSKEALVLEVLAIEAGLVNQLRAAAETDGPDAAAAVVASYLDPAERRDVAENCPLVCHPVDAIRGDGHRRAGYTARCRALFEALSDAADLDSDDAILAAVMMVGAAQLSAAVDDEVLADQVQSVGRTAVLELMALSS